MDENKKTHLEILNSSNPSDLTQQTHITDEQIEEYLIKLSQESIFKMDFSLFLKYIIITNRTDFLIQLSHIIFIFPNSITDRKIIHFFGIALLDFELGNYFFYNKPTHLLSLLKLQKTFIQNIPAISIDNSLLYKQPTLSTHNINQIVDYLFEFHSHFHPSKRKVGKILDDNFYYSFQLLKFIIDQYEFTTKYNVQSLFLSLPDEYILSSLNILSEWVQPNINAQGSTPYDTHIHRKKTSIKFLTSLNNEARTASIVFKNSIVNLFPFFNTHHAILLNPEFFL